MNEDNYIFFFLSATLRSMPKQLDYLDLDYFNYCVFSASKIKVLPRRFVVKTNRKVIRNRLSVYYLIFKKDELLRR